MEAFRPVLEVLRMSAPTAVAQTMSAVCALWRRAGSAEELWQMWAEHLQIERGNCRTFKDALRNEVANRAESVYLLFPMSLSVFNIPLGRWKTVSLPNYLEGFDYSYALFGDGTILRCGGRTYDSSTELQASLNTVVLIHRNGAVSELPGMRCHRFLHGLVCIDKCAFVFGGMHGFGLGYGGCSLSSCEELCSGAWKPLPDMARNRYEFTPCRYGKQVFLCGGNNQTVEVFDTATETFAILQGVELEGTATIAVVRDYTLIILTSEKIVERNLLDSRISTRQKQYSRYNTSTAPRYYDSSIFMADPYIDNSCQVISLASGQVIKSLKPGS